ncbi:UDP-N-acetylglucosamine transferase subunit ALG14 homolog [Selaginella moellendorffii]|uniref:UDP-N-acetylglucosamine transferase subunit ALG14 homolog n=1 Tax=Selaginella moellendorffii TaxID=88036 RepID=UPI000D1C249B|nr:UDP-N-acetylglucosamine transferase subunit ALG14 homolog [Selaginella moellendorffii]|eukprot:XP_024521168.1 UDP-N-acetylglucosamine transferase subunit ALG14 homolog [Selaginella moellendorffii]
MEDWFPLFCGAALGLVLWRLLVVYAFTGKPRAPGSRAFKTLVVLGSGGHTAEMLNVVEMLRPERYSPRIYLAAASDNMSLPRARAAEEKSSSAATLDGCLQGARHYLQIYRSREVGQSYLTSVVTTLMAIAHALWVVFRIRPDVVLCNGPGTCLPVCVAAFLLKVLGLKWATLVYVESIARVQKLSLTGLILYRLHAMDLFYVQWPQLKERFPRSLYVGRLM